MQNRKQIGHHYSQNQHYPGFLMNLALVILQYAWQALEYKKDQG